MYVVGGESGHVAGGVGGVEDDGGVGGVGGVDDDGGFGGVCVENGSGLNVVGVDFVERIVVVDVNLVDFRDVIVVD